MSLVPIQVKDTRSQQTKFGTVLVVETFSQPQRFLLGFQINPAARMDEVLKCIQNLLRSFRAQPDFGICVERITDPQIADEADMEMFDTVDEYAIARHRCLLCCWAIMVELWLTAASAFCRQCWT